MLPNSLTARVQRAANSKDVKNLIMGLALILVAGTADAAMLDSVTGVICEIKTFFSGPFLFCGGVIIIILAAIGIANSESTIIKFVSFAGVGIGVAAAAIPIMQKYGIAAYC